MVEVVVGFCLLEDLATLVMPGPLAVPGLEGLWAELVAQGLLEEVHRILGREKMGLTEP